MSLYVNFIVISSPTPFVSFFPSPLSFSLSPSLPDTPHAPCQMRRVPAEECSFDPWCGALIHQDTAPPLVTRLTVLWVALLVSLMVIWAPRILTFRPQNPALIWLRVSIRRV